MVQKMVVAGRGTVPTFEESDVTCRFGWFILFAPFSFLKNSLKNENVS